MNEQERSAAIERVRNYLTAIATCFDGKHPVPEVLVLDSATDYSDMTGTVTFNLRYADLMEIVSEEGGVYNTDAMKRAFCAGAWLAGGVSNNDRVDRAFARFLRQEAERAAQD